MVLVPTEKWDKLIDKALRFAVAMSPDVICVHLSDLEGNEGDEKTGKLRSQWAEDVENPALAAGLPPPRLEIIQSPYREFFKPLMELIGRVGSNTPVG